MQLNSPSKIIARCMKSNSFKSDIFIVFAQIIDHLLCLGQLEMHQEKFIGPSEVSAMPFGTSENYSKSQFCLSEKVLLTRVWI